MGLYILAHTKIHTTWRSGQNQPLEPGVMLTSLRLRLLSQSNKEVVIVGAAPPIARMGVDAAIHYHTRC